jgi:hypothetical protein
MMGTVQLGRLRLVARVTRAACSGCMSEAQRGQLSAIGEALTDLWEACRDGCLEDEDLRAWLLEGLTALSAYERGIAAAQGRAALTTYDRARGGTRVPDA